MPFAFRYDGLMAKCAILIDGGYLDKVMVNDFSGARVDVGGVIRSRWAFTPIPY